MRTNITENNIPISVGLIDSFSLKIPMEKVTVLDKRLTSETCIYYEALEAVDDILHPPKPLIYELDGIKVRFSQCSMPVWSQDLGEMIPTQFVCLTVSTKLLREDYFQGINKSNIKKLYQAFIDFKVFWCSYNTFLDGIASDVDICINWRIKSLGIFQGVCESLYSQAEVKQKHLRMFEGGITFNKREWASPSLPFLKLYHKELELNTKSETFKDKFLSAYNISGLTRIEATIKNYKHKKRLEKYQVIPNFKTLRELLAIPQEKLKDFVSFSLGAYIVKQTRLKAPDLSPTDHVIFELIQNCIIKGYDLESLLMIANTFEGSTEESTAVAQTRIRNRIKKMHLLARSKDATIEKLTVHNKEVAAFLKMLGVDVGNVSLNPEL